MADHALLSASSSYRWLNCPPSARLAAECPDTSSPYSLQGTQAHSLAAYKVMRALDMDAKNPAGELTLLDHEMEDCTDAYCAFVMEQLAEAEKHCSDPVVLVEQRLDFSRWVPEGFGTGDACIVADDCLHVIDFKYGMGVLVEAERNPQLMCYALGLLEAFDNIYDCFVCGHVHDELIIEASPGVDLKAVCEQMGRVPPWLPGAVLRADRYKCAWYKKV